MMIKWVTYFFNVFLRLCYMNNNEIGIESVARKTGQEVKWQIIYMTLPGTLAYASSICFNVHKITMFSKLSVVKVPDSATSSVFKNLISKFHLNIVPTNLKFNENNHILGTIYTKMTAVQAYSFIFFHAWDMRIWFWWFLLTKIHLVYEVWYNSLWPTCIIILQYIFKVCIFIKHDVSFKLSTEFPSIVFISWRPWCHAFSWNKSILKKSYLN